MSLSNLLALLQHISARPSANSPPSLHNTSALSQPTSPLIIYLPPIGTHLRSQYPPIPSFLRTPFAALAQINYRWNLPLSSTTNPSPKLLSSHPSYANHPFPTPLHDTLHAYIYLLKHYLPAFSPPRPSNSNSQRRRTLYSLPETSLPKQVQRPLLIYGSFLGGTLATSLALTESFASKQVPTTISGLIARDAVFDWTSISVSETPSLSSQSLLESEGRWQSRRALEEGWDATTLHSLKKRLFSTPASTFDSFASPLLFFRTAGLAVPTSPWDLPTPPSTASTTTTPPVSSSPTPSPSGEGERSPHIIQEYKLLMEEGILGKRVEEFDDPVTRRANLKFPPRESGLRIPRSLFLTSPSPPQLTSSTLKKKPSKMTEEEENTITPITQAEEMAKLMRRSVLLHEFKDRKLWDEDLDPSSVSEDRVQVLSLATNSETSGEEERFVREWIEDCLG